MGQEAKSPPLVQNQEPRGKASPTRDLYVCTLAPGRTRRAAVHTYIISPLLRTWLRTQLRTWLRTSTPFKTSWIFSKRSLPSSQPSVRQRLRASGKKSQSLRAIYPRTLALKPPKDQGASWI